jgi:hypothetical protein
MARLATREAACAGRSVLAPPLMAAFDGPPPALGHGAGCSGGPAVTVDGLLGLQRVRWPAPGWIPNPVSWWGGGFEPALSLRWRWGWVLCGS